MSYIGKTLASQIASMIPVVGAGVKITVNVTVAASVTAILGAAITLIAEKYLNECIKNGGAKNLPINEFLTKEVFEEAISYVKGHKSEFGIDSIISDAIKSNEK